MMRSVWMMMLLLLLLLVGWLVAGMAGPAQAADEQANCAVKAPPLTALVGTDGATYFFTYPREITPSYSGCQMTWNDTGVLTFLMRFDSGSLTEFHGYEINGVEAMTCQYKNHALLPNGKGPCSAYDEVMAGIAMRAKFGDVPYQPLPGQDPRR